jgi:phosphoribosylformylglycinamidine synthase subunit PurSL
MDMGAALPHCLTVSVIGHDARAAMLLDDARALGIVGIEAITVTDLVFLDGDVPAVTVDMITASLLADAQLLSVTKGRPVAVGDLVVETALHPGVTDARADALRRGAGLLGFTAAFGVATGKRYEITGSLTADAVNRLVSRLLANPVIERHAIGEVEPAFGGNDVSAPVEIVPMRGLANRELEALSKERGLALDPAELTAIVSHYESLDRDPTDIEIEMLAQTWSEHCTHKTFRAAITGPDGEAIVPLIRQLRNATDAIAAPFVHSAFVDNAGIIAFTDTLDLAIKAETHNHPSAVEPFGGANTGVGGVVRDVLGVSARPIALTDILCFGPTDLPADELPEGVLHPRLVRRGVIAGVADYGNKLGVANVSGAIVHDPGYTANPLVFCGCVGVLPVGSNPTAPKVGDRIVVIGGRTGRDGIRGATFSSMTMDATTGEVAGASVQIGDPIVEKGLIDVVIEARDLGLYSAITDCGAGGLSSAVGEIASTHGARVELRTVPRKYPGLAPWEVWLSEAQERMVLAVPNVAALQAVCDRYEVELADIGTFTGDGRLVLTDDGDVVADLDMTFLHDGRPQRSMIAARQIVPSPTHAVRPPFDAHDAVLKLLAHPSIRSNADVLHGYDHEIGGGTVARPYTGAKDDGPADAAVVTVCPTDPPLRFGSDGVASLHNPSSDVALLPGGRRGSGNPSELRPLPAFALGIGVNALYGAFDAYAMARACLDEAMRNVVSAGADPSRVALLDNFSWGDPRKPETLGSLAEAVRGCCDGALVHRAPFVSGKDSLNNEYVTSDGQRRSIPPTLVITALGIVPDLHRTLTTDFKAAGNELILVGDTFNELRGSHLDAVLDIDVAGVVPQPIPGAAERFQALHAAIAAGHVRSSHDLSEGGLAIAAVEMAMGGRLGAELDLAAVHPDPTVALFSETSSRFLLEVEPDHVASVLGSVPGARLVGRVLDRPLVRFADGGGGVVDIGLPEALAAWQGHVPGAQL